RPDRPRGGDVRDRPAGADREALARARDGRRGAARGARGAGQRRGGALVSGFRPGVALTLISLGAVAFFCSLGVWQVRRYQWRTADLAQKSARIELPPVSLEDAA